MKKKTHLVNEAGQLRSLMEAVDPTLTESQIDPEELSDEQKAMVQRIADAMPHKKLSLTDTHSTIHGEIVVLSIGQDAYSNPRYGSEDIRALAAIDGLRWIEFGQDRITIGL